MSDDKKTETVTIWLEAETLEAVKAKAAAEGMTLDAWIERLIVRDIIASTPPHIVASSQRLAMATVDMSPELRERIAALVDGMAVDLDAPIVDDADYTPGPKTIAAMQEARRGGLEQITLAELQAEWTQGVESGDAGELDFEELKAGARKRRKAIEAVDLSDETAVVFDPEILGGELVVRGTRVPALDILARLRAGQTTAEIHRDYPSLELVDGIDGVIRWAEKTLGADWRATDKRVTQPNAETPSETAYRILEKHGLAFPANREPIPPEEFRKLYGEGDETDEPKPD